MFQGFLFLDDTLHVNKFEDADFKCDINFLKVRPKILNPKFKDCYLWTKFCVWKNLRVLM